jgi:hypothetical protein
MSKKHFVKIAAMFKANLELAGTAENSAQESARAAVRTCAQDFADIAAKDNSAFDRARFLAACGL